MSGTAGRPGDAVGAVRELRARDVARLVELLRSASPEEEELLGTRPEEIAAIARRLFRWDARLLLGLLRLVGASPARFLVVEADRRLVGTALLSFPARAGFVSMVTVDPAYRRRGYARRLLAAARALTLRRGRPHLALDVLATNAPARALYTSLGFRPLRASAYFALDLGAAPPSRRSDGAVRPLTTQDAPAIARIADRALPSEVREVLPIRAGDLLGSRWTDRALASESAGWVYDRGRGPEAAVGATVGRATVAGHLSTPIVGSELPAEATAELLGEALAWLASHGAPRVLSRAADDDRNAVEALGAAGFRPALRLVTLARPAA